MITALALTVALATWPPPTIVFGAHSTNTQLQTCSQYHVFDPEVNCAMAFNREQTIDVSAIAPPDAIGVSLSGMLIITHGTQPELCGVMVWFRPGPGHKWGAYRGQTAEAHIGGGQRSNHTITIPMVNRTFEVWMEPQGQVGKPWPDGCAYGVNYRPDYWITTD